MVKEKDIYPNGMEIYLKQGSSISDIYIRWDKLNHFFNSLYLDESEKDFLKKLEQCVDKTSNLNKIVIIFGHIKQLNLQLIDCSGLYSLLESISNLKYIEFYNSRIWLPPNIALKIISTLPKKLIKMFPQYIRKSKIKNDNLESIENKRIQTLKKIESTELTWINGSIIKECSDSENFLLIALITGKEIYIRPSEIHNKYFPNKGYNQNFLIENRTLKHYNLITSSDFSKIDEYF